MAEKALKIRSAVKKRKPNYKRSQAHQFKKLDDGKWRRPKGMGNKVRRQRRGKLGMLQVGYKSPKVVRGLNKDGLKEVIVANIEALNSLEKGVVAVIAKTVGGKKKLQILTEAKKKNIAVANVKNIDDAIKKLTKAKKVAKKKTEVKAEVKKETKAEPKKVEAKEAKK